MGRGWAPKAGKENGCLLPWGWCPCGVRGCGGILGAGGRGFLWGRQPRVKRRVRVTQGHHLASVGWGDNTDGILRSQLFFLATLFKRKTHKVRKLFSLQYPLHHRQYIIPCVSIIFSKRIQSQISCFLKIKCINSSYVKMKTEHLLH